MYSSRLLHVAEQRQDDQLKPTYRSSVPIRNAALKKLWNMKVTIIPIVIGAFGTVTKGLLKGLEDLGVGGRVETIQATVLLRTARILRRVLET